MTQALHIRPMTRPEVDTLVDWAAAEGWNPGLHDAALFWKNDPDAFIAAELGRQVIGGGAITCYGREYGFMGFFIMRPEYRGQGFGDILWQWRHQTLRRRLTPSATIGMDGVLDMQAYYSRGGFDFQYYNRRYEGMGAVLDTPPCTIPLTDIPFEVVSAYDRLCFPADRSAFMRQWINQPDSHALGYLEDGHLAGFGVVRACREGYKIGPLFADSAAIAEALYRGLAAKVPGSRLYLDAPDYNAAAVGLARRYDMREVFACARMYDGDMPATDNHRIYGVCSFEIG